MPYSKVFIEHNPVNDISALRKKFMASWVKAPPLVEVR